MLISKFLYFIIIILLFNCCALKPKYIISNYSPPLNTAVLPFSNQTADLDGPILLRYLFSKKLQDKGYNVKSLEETDNILKNEGITSAGQLPTITHSELGKVLNVDAVFYGNVFEFNYVTLGIYYKRSVRANFKLVDTHSGELLWEDEKTSYHDKLVLDPEKIKDALGEQLKEKFVDKLLRSPLRQESEEVLNRALLTLPYRK